ncbi:MAG: electron transport complex subunit RsxC, partial [Gammaproteobacteria bacterium]|nr:electron transport complex subunit RsxC [Gammaproteobacteria bacterium]
MDTVLGAPSFRHGVHPHDHKHTSAAAIRQFPFAPELIVPLRQHLGAAAIPVVRPGEEVARGQT